MIENLRSRERNYKMKKKREMTEPYEVNNLSQYC